MDITLNKQGFHGNVATVSGDECFSGRGSLNDRIADMHSASRRSDRDSRL